MERGKPVPVSSRLKDHPWVQTRDRFPFGGQRAPRGIPFSQGLCPRGPLLQSAGLLVRGGTSSSQLTFQKEEGDDD